MATKSGLIASINGYITSIVSVTKVRNAFLDLVNSLFQTTTSQVFVTGSGNWQYNLKYKKIGNIVYIDGFINNTFAVSKTSEIMVTIPNSELYAKTGQDTIAYGVTGNTGANVQISFATSSIFLLGTLAPSQRIYINAHYQTND